MALKTKNIVISTNSPSAFQDKLNEINQLHGSNVFATQTHVTWCDGALEYTAIFFVRQAA